MEHLQQVGRLGGEATKASRDPGYYSRIGRLGVQARVARAQEGE